MNPYLATYQLDCGHGILQNHQDIVFAPSKNQAEKSFRAYMTGLPSWKVLKNLSIEKQ